MMCTSLTPHLASAFHRTSQVSQLHLPSMPMRQSIENALQTGELARSLVNTLCVEPAAQPGAGRVREHWPGVLGHTPQPQPAPTAASPASRQLRSKGPTQASAILRLAMGWCPRSPAVSTARFSLLTAGLPIRLPLQAGWRSLLVSKTFPIVLKGAL